MSRDKAEDKYGLSLDQIKDACDFLLDKLAVLFTKCLQICSVPRGWENITNINSQERKYQKSEILQSNNFTVCYIQAFYRNSHE